MLLVLLSACFKITYTNTPHASTHRFDHEVWRHRWIYGMIESQGDLSVDELCGDSGFTQIHTEVTPANALVSYGVTAVQSAVTLGATSGVQLYSPSTIQIWCDDGITYILDVAEGQAVVLAAPLSQELPDGLAFTGETVELRGGGNRH